MGAPGVSPELQRLTDSFKSTPPATSPATPPLASGGEAGPSPELQQLIDKLSQKRQRQVDIPLDKVMKVASVARQAGFKGDALNTAVAVALAESSGDPTNINRKAPDDSYGLWQINYFGNLSKDRTQKFGPKEGMIDPSRNAQAAFTLSGGGKNWRAWSTFNKGTYKKYLALARKGVEAEGKPSYSDVRDISAQNLTSDTVYAAPPQRGHQGYVDTGGGEEHQFSTDSANEPIPSLKRSTIGPFTRDPLKDLANSIDQAAGSVWIDMMAPLLSRAQKKAAYNLAAKSLSSVDPLDLLHDALDDPVTWVALEAAGPIAHELGGMVLGRAKSILIQRLGSKTEAVKRIAETLDKTPAEARSIYDEATTRFKNLKQGDLMKMSKLYTLKGEQLEKGQKMAESVVAPDVVSYPKKVIKLGEKPNQDELDEQINREVASIRNQNPDMAEEEVQTLARKYAAQKKTTPKAKEEPAKLEEKLEGKLEGEPEPETGTTTEKIGQKAQEKLSPERKKAAEEAAEEALPGKATGIAHKVLEQNALLYGSIERGVGMSALEHVERGRELIRTGTDPEKMLETFEASDHSQVSADLVSVARAHLEDLAKAHKEAIGTPKEEAARQAVADWEKRIKPVATASGETFRAHQGAVEVDTGNWQTLASIYGRDRTLKPKEIAEAKQRAAASTKATETETRLTKQVSQGVMDVATKQKPPKVVKDADAMWADFGERIKSGSIFQEKRTRQSGAISIGKDPKFTPDDRAQLWTYMRKQFLDPAAKVGNPMTLSELAARVEADASKRGVEFPADWVRDIVAGRKTTLRNLDTNLLRQQIQRQDIVNSARAWAEASGDPMLYKALRATYYLPFMSETFGHGFVFPITHAGGAGLDPLFMGSNYRSWIQSFKNIKPEELQKMYNKLEADPNYLLQRKSGLAIDPNSFDDWQRYQAAVMNSKNVKLQGALRIGQRQMEGLKMLRQSYWNKMWDMAPDALKADPQARLDLAKVISRQANHMSGTIMGDEKWGKLEEGFRASRFGPNLWRARLYKLIGDPATSLKALADPSASAAEKWMAGQRIKHGVRALATYVGSALGANWGLLKALGKSDDQNVNFFDPSRPDWLLLKDFWGNGHDITGGLQSLGRTIVREGEKAWDISQGKGRDSDLATIPWNYFKGGMAPSWQIGFDFTGLRQTDYNGQPLPGWMASDKTVAKAESKGKEQETGPEWFFKRFAPIPFQGIYEPAKEAFQEEGFSPKFAGEMAESVVEAFTGARQLPASAIRSAIRH